jgi:orotate phosphoribosyltransferase-like protein
MIYYVTIKVEETLVIDDVCNEAEAIKRALQCFDPTAGDPEVVEVWDDSDD